MRKLPLLTALAALLLTALLCWPAAGAQALTAGSSGWTEPQLTNPQVILLSSSNHDLTLSDSRDYILACPSALLVLPSHLQVTGGHNVVFANCSIELSSADWAARFESQTGTLWIDDVHFGGSDLTGGFQLQEPGDTTVTLEDVLFDEVHGSQSTNHAECVQTWSGPQQLLIDGLQCTTTYQGLFLLPNQWDSTTHETNWDFRNVEITGDGGYDLWLGDVLGGAIPSMEVDNVYDCGPGEPRDYDGTTDGGRAWSDVKACPEVPPSIVSLTGNPAAPVTGVADADPPAPTAGTLAAF